MRRGERVGLFAVSRFGQLAATSGSRAAGGRWGAGARSDSPILQPSHAHTLPGPRSGHRCTGKGGAGAGATERGRGRFRRRVAVLWAIGGGAPRLSPVPRSPVASQRLTARGRRGVCGQASVGRGRETARQGRASSAGERALKTLTGTRHAGGPRGGAAGGHGAASGAQGKHIGGEGGGRARGRKGENETRAASRVRSRKKTLSTVTHPRDPFTHFWRGRAAHPAPRRLRPPLPQARRLPPSPSHRKGPSL